MNQFAITVVGRDRRGAVADVAAALAGLGLNLTDSTMTLLGGHFAMMLLCSEASNDGAQAADTTADVTKADVTEADVAAALAPLNADGDLLATARALPPEAEQGVAGEPYQLVVHGADRLGIVSAVTRLLATAGGNITDLSTRLAGPLYLLTCEVDMPATADVLAVRAQLAGVAARLGVEASLRLVEADML